MTLEARRKAIAQLEQERKSRVVTLITGDRHSDIALPGLPGKIAGDQARVLYDHLRDIGHTQRLDLFLYTRGGDSTVPWVFVNLLRSHCEHLGVLVPYRAHSAGTLICLGADEIVMGTAGELSPIDPTTGNQFNPQDPNNPASRLGINVEDVTSYISLATDKVGLTDKEHVLAVFKQLAEEVHPLALGNVSRTHTQIRLLAQKLLALHMKGEGSAAQMERIVDILTERLYSHLHFIGRREASEDVGLKIIQPSAELEERMWNLYTEYEEALSLRKPIIAEALLGEERETDLTVPVAFMQSAHLSHVCRVLCRIRREPRITPQLQAQIIANLFQLRCQQPDLQPNKLPDELPTLAGLESGYGVRMLSGGWQQEEEENEES